MKRAQNIRRAGLAVLLTGAVFAGAACEPGQGDTAQDRSRETLQTVQKKYETAVPFPIAEMNDSLERRQLREKLRRYNVPDKISYIYLLSDTGSVVAFYPIKGKVSNNSSQLTSSQLLERCIGPATCVVDAPSDDGSYGPNEDGIFFFTTDNVMVTWNGKYLLADQSLKVTSAPVLVR